METERLLGSVEHTTKPKTSDGVRRLLWVLWSKSSKDAYRWLIVIAARIIYERMIFILDSRQQGIIADHLATGEHHKIYRSFIICTLLQLSDIASQSVAAVSQHELNTWCGRSLATYLHQHVMNQDYHFHRDKSTAEKQKVLEMSQTIPDLFEYIVLDGCPLLFDFLTSSIYIRLRVDLVTAVVAVSICMLTTLISILQARWVSGYQRVYNDLFYEAHVSQAQILEHYLEIFQDHLFRRQNRIFTDLSARLASRQNAYLKQHEMYDFVRQIASFAAIGVPLILVIRSSVLHRPSISVYVTTYMLLEKMRRKTLHLLKVYTKINKQSTNLERLWDMLEMSPKIVDGRDKIYNARGHIEFINVSYPSSGTVQILKNLSFVARPGEILAFVGKSGQGKTTILHLLLRFYDDYDGEILLDGKDIRDLNIQNLRSHFGYVSQTISLIGSTFRETISHGYEASQSQIEEACKLAGIHQRIITRLEGYDADIGAGASYLSGGERQRVAIARLHLRLLTQKISVVALDEATSAQDTDNAGLVMKNMRPALAERTCLMITHQLQYAKQADKIIVLESG